MFNTGVFSELFASLGAYSSVVDSNLMYVQILYILYFGKCLLLLEQKTNPNRKLSLLSSGLKGKYLTCSELQPHLFLLHF